MIAIRKTITLRETVLSGSGEVVMADAAFRAR